MINEIIMKNIKGQVDSQPLTGRDIICGANGAGKTTRAQALGISLLGYVPGGGKLPGETYKLCSGGAMTVGLKTDWFEFTRKFKCKTSPDGRGGKSITQELDVTPGKGEKSGKEKEARIASELGNLPVMLDFNEFLSLSDAKRREFFYSLAGIDASKWNKKGVYFNLQNKLFTDELKIEKNEIWYMLDAALSEVMKKYDSDDIQASIQNMLNHSKDMVSHWKAQKQNAEAASQKISEYKNELQVTDRNLEKNKGELEKLQNELMNISNIIAVNKEKQRAEASRISRIGILKDEIAALRKETPSGNEAEIQDSMIKLKAQVKEAPDIKTRIDMLRKGIEGFREIIEENESSINIYKSKLMDARSNFNTYAKLLGMISQNKGHCAIDPRISCEKNFDKFIAYANEQTKASERECKSSEIIIAKAEETIAQTKDRIKKAENEIQHLMDEEISARRHNESINNQIFSLKQTLLALKGFEDSRNEKIKFRKDELKRLATESKVEIQDISCEISRKVEIEARLSELKVLIDSQTKTRIRLLDFKNSVIDGKEAEYNLECWKLISKALGPVGIQGEIVKSILNPIKEAVQDKLDAMNIQKEFFFETSSENGKEVFEFGWLTGSRERLKFEALSNGEQMLLLIALITTIIERKNPPLKVLMIDNIECLDRENFKKVIAGMDKVAQNLDNVILLGVTEPEPEDCPGWRIWNLEQNLSEDSFAGEPAAKYSSEEAVAG